MTQGKPAPAPADTDQTRVRGIDIAWQSPAGTCTFAKLPVVMMWMDSTLAGVMSGVQAMVGTARFGLAMQSEGRKSVAEDWKIISQSADFRRGFEAIAHIAAVAGWGRWELVTLDEENQTCRFRVTDSWEGRYKKTLHVCWGSAMLAGKLAGYCSNLFGTNCWADQTAFIAQGNACDEFVVHPSDLSVETEIENLLATDEATRADMAVALKKLRSEMAERMRVEKALRESEAHLTSIFRAAPTGIGVVSNRIIKGANDRLCNMLGYTREELLGLSGRRVYPTDEDYAYVGREKYAQIQEYGTGTVETRWQRKDGTIIEVLLSSSPLDPDDLAAGVTFTALDITDRKRAEEEREGLIRTLEAQNAELERFTYMVSHDLKNPLITIRGFLGLLEKDIASGEPEAVRGDMERMVQAVDKMEQLLNELLDLSRIGRLVNPPTAVPLGELAEEAAQLVKGRIDRQRVRIVISPDLPTVVGDRPRLSEVLQNLIDNAAKYMGDQPEPRIEIGCRREGTEIVCFVRDNGGGIEPRYHDKIFGLFEQLDPEAEGSGVGLALVKRIVEIHGGRLWVESDGPGQGSTFYFTLPLEGTRE